MKTEETEMPKFAAGDIVRLKGGGPALTIEYQMAGSTESGQYRVVWFAADGTLCRDALTGDLLDAVAQLSAGPS
ncbi:DUF2158 domain-containing protein [Mesorhizobium sp. M0293]|uniref:DUF2158 domain-containing protein n=1 Tax=Mesorhizobium sp. M0293 TaxID=2956930 RepID=UPI003338502F